MTKCFERNFKVFFLNLNPLLTLYQPTPALPAIGDCKDTKLFIPRNFFLKKFLKYNPLYMHLFKVVLIK
ncbi:hypothetical protein QE441_001939 [Chryseobacterium sp. SORGH_AS909]|uniref:Uncharacterized protein n=1 Tax=Chryseobacterium camelliae TaxID=1265445 RepID=A0ABU0TCT0_9FLAO|nr:hypothetical protein [Chryseobacterium camelliae]MDQ1098794.1 hypothetical protein [Chryseobacterium sp. SORGH_AS_1048]MDR6086051.1 hypothetical protein [Chryseobacterium sp. SORGH_AS_0909]MDR6130419.1 hypothetical protein [Chryseobacterium sp. SORGH_AS_1175]MDT3407357.1 hypothetical protein [Pseudacidovorax intermedius]